MFWKVFYTVGFLSQCRLCYEIEEYELKIPYDFMSSLEVFEEEMPAILESFERENFIGSEEMTDDVADSTEETPAEPEVSFAGPVKAKGAVSVAATFGYDPPTSQPSLSNIGPSWFQPAFFPQYFFPAAPMSATPMPLTFSHIPLLSMLLPEVETTPFTENTKKRKFKDTVESKPASKEIFLEITPGIKVEQIFPAASRKNPSVELISSDGVLANPVEFLDEDFTDYDATEVVEHLPAADDLHMKGSQALAGGMAFGGFLPASGTVKIAARY